MYVHATHGEAHPPQDVQDSGKSRPDRRGEAESEQSVHHQTIGRLESLRISGKLRHERKLHPKALLGQVVKERLVRLLRVEQTGIVTL